MFKNEEVKSERTIDEEIEAIKEKLATLEKQKAEKALAEKEAAKITRKEEADVVKQAITKRLEGEAAAKKAKAAAYKTYLEACDTAEAEVSKLRAAEKEQLEAFCKKYGAYHESIQLGDATYSYHYSNEVSAVDPFKKLLSDFWLL